jgi:hypothetical protein
LIVNAATQALARRLSPEALRNARLACQLWALHLLAGVSRITVWPALLTSQEGRRGSRARSVQPRDPGRLLQCLDPSSVVKVLCSTPRKPTQQQLRQLWQMLAASPVQQLWLGIVNEGGDLDYDEAFAKQLLSSLYSQPALLQRLRALSLAVRHETSLRLPAGGLTSLRSLRCGRHLLLNLPELRRLAQHCRLLEQLHLAVGNRSDKLQPQQVLDALQPLQQLRDLQLDGMPYDQAQIHIPDWPRLTRLVSRGAVELPFGGAPKLLPPGLCSRLQELQVGAVQLPRGVTELAALTKVLLSSEQLREGREVPSMPRLLELLLEGDASYPQLLPVVQQLPSVTVRRWPPAWASQPCPYLAPAKAPRALQDLRSSSHLLLPHPWPLPPTRPWTSASSTTPGCSWT